MCGIAGIISPDPRREQPLKRMLGALEHRGPDGEGIHHDPDVSLGHRRLSIIDLAGSPQPMHSADGRAAIVFNGEIYNYRELRESLAARGHSFQTATEGTVDQIRSSSNTTLTQANYKYCADYAGYAQQYLQDDHPGTVALSGAGVCTGIRGQVLEPVPQRRPLSGRDLQARDHTGVLHLRVDHVQGRDDLRESRLFTGTHVRPGMRDEVRDAQQRAAVQLLDEQLDALPPELLVRGTEIDQVTVVADGVLDLRFFLVREPVADFAVGQRLALPLPLVLGEDLHAVHVELARFEERVVQAAGDGEMGAEHG